MKLKLSLSVFVIAFVTLTSAQDQTHATRKPFGNKPPTAKERVLDSLYSIHPWFATSHFLTEKKIPVVSKAASNFTARLDSILYDQFQKRIFNYAGNGNLTLETEFYKFGPIWSLIYSAQFAYDDNDQVIEKVISNGSGFANRETYSWQEDDLLTEMIEYEWSMNEWKPTFKHTNAYDGDGKLIEEFLYIWNQSIEEFEFGSQTTYQYNESGGLLESIRSVWANMLWQPDFKEIHTLNNENQPVSSISFLWELTQEIWEPVSSIDFEYNLSGLEAVIVYSSFTNGNALPEVRINQEYDDVDRMISQELLLWNAMENSWGGLNKDVYQFDEMGNVIEELLHFWNPLTNDYTVYGKEVSTYDLDFPSADIMAPHGYSDSYANMVLNITFFLLDETDYWVEKETRDLYYTPLGISSTAHALDQHITIYPNPFRETIRLDSSYPLSDFTIFDLQGRVVLQKQLSGETEINTGYLPAGMYLYQIDGLNSRQTGKLVRE